MAGFYTAAGAVSRIEKGIHGFLLVGEDDSRCPACQRDAALQLPPVHSRKTQTEKHHHAQRSHSRRNRDCRTHLGRGCRARGHGHVQAARLPAHARRHAAAGPPHQGRRTLITEGGRAGAQNNVRTALDTLNPLLHDGCNFIKGLAQLHHHGSGLLLFHFGCVRRRPRSILRAESRAEIVTGGGDVGFPLVRDGEGGCESEGGELLCALGCHLRQSTPCVFLPLTTERFASVSLSVMSWG